jgi:hypothetical protein
MESQITPGNNGCIIVWYCETEGSLLTTPNDFVFPQAQRMDGDCLLVVVVSTLAIILSMRTAGFDLNRLRSASGRLACS